MEPEGGWIVSAWEKAVVCGIYTMTPLHVSSGQAEGAIDLPVTKETHTGFPVIPASSLKGVARDELKDIDLKDEMFGPKVDGEKGRELFAGALVFTEARLVAYAARSLNRPFLYVTSRLVLERLARDLRAAGIGGDLGSLSLPPTTTAASVLVADKALASNALVLEDFVYRGEAVVPSPDLAKIAGALARLLPADDEHTRDRLTKSLVLIPDDDFAMLARRLPVRARIKLDEKTKTTSANDGNLWYEEQVPSDCLFVSMIGARRGKAQFLSHFEKYGDKLEVCQIGGNETVGEGICFWTVGLKDAKPAKEAR